jgi:hypothetical protein
MSKGRALQRVLFALCTAALLLGDVFRGFHLLHVRHVVCAEHGELVDAENLSPTAGTASDRTEALPGNGDAHHHDHCGIAAAPSRTAHLAIASAAGSIRPLSGHHFVSKSFVRVAQGRAILSYAPKQSPPV